MDDIERDPCLDSLLSLNGQILVVDDELDYWVKFEVRKTQPSKERPHGLRYSFTLHNKKNERIMGFDNAHAVTFKGSSPGNKKRQHDHKHHFRDILPYEYTDAGTLLSDFWFEVDKVLKEAGKIR